MADFVAATVTTDSVTLLDNAIDSVNSNLAAAGLPGWQPSDADLATIVLAATAEMLADVSTVAGTVVPAIFRAFGTQLQGIPYTNGTLASVLATFTFTSPAPSAGYTIEAGTTVLIDGFAFYVQSTVTTAASATSQQVTLVAAQAGTTYNGLGGVNTSSPNVQLNDTIDWVSAVTTAGVTSGGGDQETDSDYQNRLVSELALQAPRPLVAADFASMLLTDIAANATGVTVGRATSLDGYFPDGRALSTGGAGSTAISCTTTNASAAVTYGSLGSQAVQAGASVSGTGVPAGTFTANTVSGSKVLAAVSSFTSCGVGTLVSGSGIPAGASIIAVNVGASTATMSQAASATASGVTVTPTQTVLASPAPTDISFSLSVNATTSATNSLTFSTLTGYGPAHLTCVATTSNTSPTISAVTPPYPGAIADVGARVTGTAIPLGATVLASPAPTSSSFTISANATGSHTGETVTVSSWTTVANAVTSFVTDASGNPLTSAQMDVLLAWLQKYRPQNWLVNLSLASYNTVYVSCVVHCLPGFDLTATATAAQAALLALLNPGAWGNPTGQSSGANNWFNSGQGFNVVRYNKLIGVVEAVSGVDYVSTLTLGFSASPSGTADLTMSGPAPLPASTSSTVVVTTI